MVFLIGYLFVMFWLVCLIWILERFFVNKIGKRIKIKLKKFKYLNNKIIYILL